MEWIILSGLIIGLSGVTYVWRKAHRIHLKNKDIYMRAFLRKLSREIERREG